MALIPLTSVNEGNSQYVTWVLGGADTGQPLQRANMLADKTVHIFGTFDSATITLQGSNDPRVISDPGNAAWFTMVDPQGNGITATSAKGEALLENPRYIRAISAGGGASASVSIVIASRGDFF